MRYHLESTWKISLMAYKIVFCAAKNTLHELKKRIILTHASNFSLSTRCAHNLITLNFPVVKDAVAVLWQCSHKCISWTIHVRLTLFLFTISKQNRYKVRRLVYNWELLTRTWVVFTFLWPIHACGQGQLPHNKKTVDSNNYVLRSGQDSLMSTLKMIWL